MVFKKSLIVRVTPILLLMGYFLILPLTVCAEDLTITTYYPAPFGAYDRIKLVPREPLPESPYCDDVEDVGLMYYNNGTTESAEGIYVCQENVKDEYKWIFVSKVITRAAEPAGNQKVVCVKTDDSFGVCMNNPSADGTCFCQ